MFTIFCNEVGDWCEMTDCIIVCHISRVALSFLYRSPTSLRRTREGQEPVVGRQMISKLFHVSFINQGLPGTTIFFSFYIGNLGLNVVFFSIRPAYLMLLYISSPIYDG